MNTIRISSGELEVGSALTWPVYSETGRLVLNVGHVLQSQRQLEMMISKGLYRESAVQESTTPNPAPTTPAPQSQTAAGKRDAHPATERKCPFDIINRLAPELRETLARTIEGRKECIELIRSLAGQIQVVCEHDSDAALGAVHLWYDDSYPIAHLIHVSLLTELMMRRLQLGAEQRLSAVAGALTSNIAMLNLQQKLAEYSGTLSEEDRQEIHEHPRKGFEMLQKLGVTDETWLNAVLHHHERPDGTGYNQHLPGSKVGVEPKILMLADIYTAMITPCAHRAGKLAKDALREIFLTRGKDVDEQLAVLFIKELGVYPPGTVVNLENGEQAVVVARGVNGTAPDVMTIMNAKGKAYPEPFKRSCKQPGYSVRSMLPRDPNICLNLRMLWNYM